MFPEGSPSSSYVRGAFLAPDDADRSLLMDYERGGVHLNDPSQGLDYQVWKMWYDADNSQIKLSTLANTDETVVLTSGQITELSFTFDQNMRLAMVYVENTIAKFRWFDPIQNAVVTDVLQGATSPMIALDEKRSLQLSDSDIVLAYVRDGSLYYRLQRERFLTEHALAALPPGVSRIMNLGMSSQNRVQVLVKTTSAR